MHKWLLSFRARMAGLLAWVPRPVRRLLWWTVVAVPAALLVFTLALVPFTPGISDIRKAKSELPAQLMSADGKLLAEYRWANREWVELNQISPHVIDALIATEDHRFYKHFGLAMNREEGKREVPDHISAELEFMHFLTFKETQAIEEGTEDLLQGYLLAQKDFLQQQLYQWLPAFVEKLEAACPMPFYVALGRLVSGVVVAELEQVKSNQPPTVNAGALG